LASVHLIVSDPEVAKPPTLGLAFSLRDRPHRAFPEYTFSAKLVKVGTLIQILRSERFDDLNGSSADCVVVLAEGLNVESGTQVGDLIIRHASPNIAERNIQTCEPVVLIEDLWTIRNEHVERILASGHMPDEPRERAQPVRTEAHLLMGQILQELSRHLRVHLGMVYQEEFSGVHRLPSGL
jgi:hypothetical protein